MSSRFVTLALTVVLLLSVNCVVAGSATQDLTGIIDVIHVDDFVHPENMRYEYYLRTADGQYRLAPNPSLDPSLAGATVTARGTTRDADLVSAGAIDVSPVLSYRDPLPENIGPQRTLALVMAIAGAQPPATVERVRHELFDASSGPIGPTTTTTQSYYNATSYGKTSFVGDVVGMSLNASVCDMWQMFNQGLIAASPSVDIASYDRVVIVTPCTPCICTGGMGTLGKMPNWVLPDGRVVNVSVAWNFQFSTMVASHELGHNFGGSHAASALCRNASQVLAQYGLNCEISYEYGDQYDVLGGGVNEMNAAHRTELGWLNKKQTKTVTNGTYDLVDLDTRISGSQIQQLTLPVYRDTGLYAALDNVYYSVEYRTNMYSIGGNRSGVGIRLFKRGPMWYRLSSPFSFIQTLILNADAPQVYEPWVHNGADGLLSTPGAAFTDDINGYRITLNNRTSTSASVSVVRIPQRPFNLSQPLSRFTFEQVTPAPNGASYVTDAAGYAQPALAYNLLLRQTGNPTETMRKGNTVGLFSDATNITPSSVSSYMTTGSLVPAFVHEQQASTVSFWMWVDEYSPTAGYPYELNMALAGPSQVGLQLHTSDADAGLFFRTCFMAGQDTVCATTRTALPSTGAWHHVAGVYDGAAQYVYIDGALRSSAPKPAGTGGLAFYQNSAVMIGGYAWDQGQYNGYLDDVTFWARALTAREVKNIAASPPAPIYR